MEDSRAHNPEVAGSNPAPATLKIKKWKERKNVIKSDQKAI